MKKIFVYLTLGFTTLTSYAATPLWMRDIQISPDGNVKNLFLTLDDIGQRMDTVVIYQHGPLTFIVALHRQLMAIPIEQRSIIISIADLFKKTFKRICNPLTSNIRI